MNSISVLLGVSAVILLAVLALSLGSLRTEVASQSSEREKLRQELALLNQMSAAGEQPKEASEQQQDEIDAMKAELESLKIERAAAAQLAAQANLPEPEPEPEMSESDERRLERRAKLIGAAMVMAQVQQYFPEDGFASLSIISYENVQEGVVLAVRRNTGIIGQLKVSTVEGNEAIADALTYTFLGESVDIRAGDELILPPL